VVQQRVVLDQAIWQPLDQARSPSSWIQAVRSWVRLRLHSKLAKTDAGLARALLLGESQAAPVDQRSAYRQLGLLHLLCISGLHFWVWGGLLRRLLPSKVRWLRWPCLLVLAGLAQFSAPVVRAATALVLREWLAARGRACLAWQLWACALWVELARSSGLPMGFLLSYAATAGLLWTPHAPGRHWLLRTLLPSAAAFLATAPLVHTWQATLEPWSIPLTPVFASLLPFRLLGSALTCLPGGAWFGNGLFTSTRFLEDLCLDLLAGLPGTPWPLPHFSSMNVSLACAVCLLLLRMRAKVAWSSSLALTGFSLVAWAPDPSASQSRTVALHSDPGNWVVASADSGSWLIPLDNDRLASRLKLGSGLLPFLAQAQARPP
jgi:competence protein ComEC